MKKGDTVNVSDFLSYLLRHEASRDLAIDLTGAYVRRVRAREAPARVVARAS